MLRIYAMEKSFQILLIMTPMHVPSIAGKHSTGMPSGLGSMVVALNRTIVS
jgi:hypothetical protein